MKPHKYFWSLNLLIFILWNWNKNKLKRNDFTTRLPMMQLHRMPHFFSLFTCWKVEIRKQISCFLNQNRPMQPHSYLHYRSAMETSFYQRHKKIKKYDIFISFVGILLKLASNFMTHTLFHTKKNGKRVDPLWKGKGKKTVDGKNNKHSESS